MEAVILIGAQASGKSTFYLRNYQNTHIRINLDMLKTRHRESLLLHACIEMKQRFVVDNTNPTPADRQRYIQLAREAGFWICGYYFESKIDQLLKRNRSRPEDEQIPDIGIRATYNKLIIPKLDEGFDTLYYVKIQNNEFIVEEWQDEI